MAVGDFLILKTSIFRYSANYCNSLKITSITKKATYWIILINNTKRILGFKLKHVWGPPKPWNLLIKIMNLFYNFKLQSPSKYSPFDTIHLLRHFSTPQNSVWTYRFSVSAIFLFLFLLIDNTFSLRTFSRWKREKKIARVRLDE